MSVIPVAAALTALTPASSQEEQNRVEFALSQQSHENREAISAYLTFLQLKLKNAQKVSAIEKPLRFFQNLPRNARLALYTVKEGVIAKANSVASNLHHIRECDELVIGNADADALVYNPRETTAPQTVKLELTSNDADEAIQPLRVVFSTNSNYYLSDGYSIRYCVKINDIRNLIV
jgi:hypothetical protein